MPSYTHKMLYNGNGQGPDARSIPKLYPAGFEGPPRRKAAPQLTEGQVRRLENEIAEKVVAKTIENIIENAVVQGLIRAAKRGLI